MTARSAGTSDALEALRRLVTDTCPELDESTKWSAPNFSLAGEDRVTLGVQKTGAVRMVLHRGARKQDASGFRFDDPAGLASWPAPDRGVVVLADAAEVEAKAELLRDLVRRWIAVTR